MRRRHASFLPWFGCIASLRLVLLTLAALFENHYWAAVVIGAFRPVFVFSKFFGGLATPLFNSEQLAVSVGNYNSRFRDKQLNLGIVAARPSGIKGVCDSVV